MAQINLPEPHTDNNPKPKKTIARYEPDPNDPDNIWGWMSQETRDTLDELLAWSSVNAGPESAGGGITQRIRDRRSSSGAAAAGIVSKL